MSLFVEVFLLILSHQTLWFLLAQYKRDNSLADIGWGTGFVFVALWCWWQVPSPTSFLLFVLAGLWGIRLSGHIYLRHRLSGQEDWRYRNMRQGWSDPKWLQALLRVFWLQGMFMFLIALPLPLAAIGSGELHAGFVIAGTALWLFGWLYETIADYQLYRFKAAPGNKGKTLRAGLWQYSRHPNYFGEIVLWWGLFIATLPTAAAWIGLISPVCLTWLLLRVSGIPLLEAKKKETDSYRRYQQDIPAIIPRFLLPF